MPSSSPTCSNVMIISSPSRKPDHPAQSQRTKIK
uniref:Uncharacterized protein n=1 Tax=Arundo donax TaxID=35708 RepID=A0A0A8YWL5_ARUDO